MRRTRVRSLPQVNEAPDLLVYVSHSRSELVYQIVSSCYAFCLRIPFEQIGLMRWTVDGGGEGAKGTVHVVVKRMNGIMFERRPMGSDEAWIQGARRVSTFDAPPTRSSCLSTFPA